MDLATIIAGIVLEIMKGINWRNANLPPEDAAKVAAREEARLEFWDNLAQRQPHLFGAPAVQASVTMTPAIAEAIQKQAANPKG